MKGVLLLNGQPYSGEIDCQNAVVYCCDGAYEWAKDRVRIDKNVGDFDSLGYIPYPPPEEIFPAEKNFTDGEIAVRKMIAQGLNRIEIYGGGGGREDHFIGNLQLLYYCRAHGVEAVMINDGAVIFAASGTIALGEYAGKTFSVLPFGDRARIIKGEGCKYAYPPELRLGECRGISNIVESKTAYLEIDERDCALIIINRGKV
ncbi:MAG: thiamine diphosphokinase [Candidatus Coproplasma sp.]